MIIYVIMVSFHDYNVSLRENLLKHRMLQQP